MTEQQPMADVSSTIAEAIDRMVQRINRFKIDPGFSQQVEERSRKVPDFAMDDRQILRHLMVLIAYSNNANSVKVTRLVESEVFESIFQKYFVEKKTSELTAKSIVDDCWADLRAIRFKYKVDAWVRCARCLHAIQGRHGSFMKYLDDVGLPSPIKSECDIRAFWEGFDKIRAYLLALNFPYFANFTSLCHLLLHLGFDCAKPDIIVMKVAVDLGIVSEPPKQKKNPEKSRAHPEASLKKAIKTIQAYAVSRNTRAPVIDLYFLIHGRQAAAIGLVDPAYYSSES
jgi:3-methyladenine DNA glycosylase Tag